MHECIPNSGTDRVALQAIRSQGGFCSRLQSGTGGPGCSEREEAGAETVNECMNVFRIPGLTESPYRQSDLRVVSAADCSREPAGPAAQSERRQAQRPSMNA